MRLAWDGSLVFRSIQAGDTGPVPLREKAQPTAAWGEEMRHDG